MRLRSRMAASIASVSPSPSPTTSFQASSTPTRSGRLESKVCKYEYICIITNLYRMQLDWIFLSWRPFNLHYWIFNFCLCLNRQLTIALVHGRLIKTAVGFDLSWPFISTWRHFLLMSLIFFAVENQKMMLGTFSPQQEPYVYEGEEETTPAGIFARGSYSAKLKVTR